MITTLTPRPRWSHRFQYRHSGSRIRISVHALHKSATMFLFRFFQQVARDRQLAFYSENLAENGQPPSQGGHSFCVAPVRTFEFQNVPSDHRIVHVRDPRDMLVSEFFSFGWIHADRHQLDQRRKAIQAMSIDDYVLNQPQFSNWPLEAKFEPLLQHDLKGPGITVIKYEQMVLDFESWAATAIVPFGFRFPKLRLRRYRQKFSHEFEPKPEAMTHRRKMLPGDHREKLQSKTIRILNRRFAPILETFGYEI